MRYDASTNATLRRKRGADEQTQLVRSLRQEIEDLRLWMRIAQGEIDDLRAQLASAPPRRDATDPNSEGV